MPNFLLIGGKKCGTTVLYSMLRQHPDVFFPQKEIHFFSYEGRPAPAPHVVTDFADYSALFAARPSATIRGDASPSYLAFPGAAERIRAYLDDVKLMAILRHPVDRLYSDYLHERRIGQETAPTLAEALASDDEVGRFNYRVKSNYNEHLARYFRLFGRDRVLVTLNDDLVADAPGFVARVFAFLGVDATCPVDTRVRAMPSGAPRNRVLEKAISRGATVKSAARRVIPSGLYTTLSHRARGLTVERSELEPSLRRSLLEEYEPEVAAMEALLGRELPAWRA